MAFSNMAFYYYYGAFKKPGMYCMCFTYKIECQQNEQIHQFKKKSTNSNYQKHKGIRQDCQ